MYKFGLFTYSTENIGDEIQSIAAKRFLPHVDYYFDRDDIDATPIKSGDKVKLIMNGWYMAEPYNFPPKNKNLEPLLISMYVERDNEYNRTDLAFLSKEGRAFIKKYGPLGARDTGTNDFLRKNGVDTYFSGCLTLTLLPDSRIKKQDFILAVDVSQKIQEKIKKSTKREMVVLNTERHTSLSSDEKMVIAQYWLSLYQSAHCVVTKRLHAILPCLAFGTPVFAIKQKDSRRFGGLIDLANAYSETSFLRANIDFENPPKNPDTFKTISGRLVDKCRDFTGYDSKKSYLLEYKDIDFLNKAVFISAINKLADNSYQEQRDNGNKATIIDNDKTAISWLESKTKLMDEEINRLRLELDRANTPGVKRSLCLLGASIKRRLLKK